MLDHVSQEWQSAEMTAAFPLQWPVDKPRNRRPTRSRFNVTFVSARDGLLEEIRMLKGTLPVISTNIELRRDGLPYAGRAEPNDSGVAVYFQLGNRPMCFACDRWDCVKDNMQAIRHTIAALRGIDRWGSGDMVEQAFRGFVALPPASTPHVILGVDANAGRAEVERAFRSKVKQAHPDCGGSNEQMTELLEAKKNMLSRT